MITCVASGNEFDVGHDGLNRMHLEMLYIRQWRILEYQTDMWAGNRLTKSGRGDDLCATGRTACLHCGRTIESTVGSWIAAHRE